MPSEIICLKLNSEELAMMESIRHGTGHGTVTRSEIVRLLIRREYVRRMHSAKRRKSMHLLDNSQWSGEWRAGRPKKEVAE